MQHPMQPSKTEQLCPECQGTLVTDSCSGEIVCKICGLVVVDRVFASGPEWRASESDKRSRAGSPSTFALHDRGLSTVVGLPDVGRLSAERQAQLWRLRKWQQRCRATGIERSLSSGLEMLEKFADKLYVPRAAQEQAALLYRKALYKGLVKGRTISSLVAAALYLACRQSGVLRRLDDVANASRVDRCLVGACYRLMIEHLELQPPRPVSPAAYVAKVSALIGVSGQVQGEAFRLCRQLAARRYCVGKDPKTVAAALLYVAVLKSRRCGDGVLVTQKRLAIAAGVTEVAIRNRYKEICKQLGLVLVSRRIEEAKTGA